MKNWKNILLTALVGVLLIGFAWAVVSPTITEEAKDAHEALNADENDPYADMPW